MRYIETYSSVRDTGYWLGDIKLGAYVLYTLDYVRRLDTGGENRPMIDGGTRLPVR